MSGSERAPLGSVWIPYGDAEAVCLLVSETDETNCRVLWLIGQRYLCEDGCVSRVTTRQGVFLPRTRSRRLL